MKMEISRSDLGKLMEAVLDTAVDGIITIDTNGFIINVNKSALALFGYKLDELVGYKINMLMGIEHSTQHDQYISRFLNTRKAKIIGIGREVLGKKKNGDLFPFRLAVSEVILNDKILFTGIIHDLTDVNAAREELVAINKELDAKVVERTYEVEKVVNQLLSINKLLKEEISERIEIQNKLTAQEKRLLESLEKEKELGDLKSKFVTIASHEFRTPLATILSSASLISRYKLEDQQENRDKHTEKIKIAVNNLTGILNDFLSLSRLEENTIMITKSDIDLKSLLEESIEEVSIIQKDGQNIKVTIDGVERKIMTDEKMFKNVIFNLVSNAIKYSECDIICNLIFKENSIELNVIDQGIGISEADKKHVFTRFFRSSNVTNIQGTGLGLNIVGKYAEVLGGDVRLESEENLGTTVKFTLFNV